MAHEKRTVSTAKKAAIALTALAAFLLYVKEAATQLAASRTAAPGDHPALLAAIRYSPNNAEYRFRLGESYLTTQDYAPAITHLKRSVELNPNRAQAWLQLAHAYHFTGENQQRRAALAQAVAAAPFNHRVAWDAANLYLATGDTDAAFKRFAHVVNGYPEARAEALKLCWRASRDSQRLVAELGIKDPASFADLFTVLVNEPVAAKRVFPSYLETTSTLHPESLNRYLGISLNRQDAATLLDSWNLAERRFAELRPYRHANNALGNASFEQPMRFAAFDWQWTSSASASILTETADVKDSAHAIALHLRNHPAGPVGLSQTAIVTPGTWQLSGFSKAQGVDTAEVRVTGSKGEVLATLAIGGGDSVWRQYTTEFQIPAGTELVGIQFTTRSAVQQGSLKLDGFSLREVSR